ELRGELLLDSRREQPLWASNLKWSGVKLEKWLKPRNELARKSERIRLKKPAGATAAPPFVSGTLGGQAKLHGSGKSTAAMLSTLQGTAQTWIRNGEISQLVLEGSGLDAAQALGLLVRGDKNVQLHCAALGFKADKGKLQTETGIVDSSDTLLLLNGNISLVDEQLDLTLRAKPHDASPLSLRAPLHVRGSFAEPRIRPDGSTVGLKLGAAALLGIAVSPFAAIIPLIDPGSSDKGGSCAETLARLQQAPETPAGMKQALQAKR
ncbi:MAG: AsmA-like C-terminal region-containing protein, partial [Pedobacter sp.]|nr:AsmA-like C-terminal region-containing protein [Pedobacter sp.]